MEEKPFTACHALLMFCVSSLLVLRSGVIFYFYCCTSVPSTMLRMFYVPTYVYGSSVVWPFLRSILVSGYVLACVAQYCFACESLGPGVA